MKRLICSLVSLLLALMIFVSQPAATFAAGEWCPYHIYEAEYYAPNFEEIFEYENTSYARNFYRELSADMSFMAGVAAWEGLHITTDPSYSLESGMITMKDFYRTALFDLLCAQTSAETGESYVDALYNGINNDYTKLLVDCTKTVTGETFTPDKLKGLKLTEEYKQILVSETGAGKFAGGAEKALWVLRGAKSIYDGVDLMAKYCSIQELNRSTTLVLQYIVNDDSNEIALRVAAGDLIACLNGGVEQTVQALGSGTGETFKGLLGLLVDVTWDALVAMTPGANVVFLGLKGVRAFANFFSNNDAKIQAFYQIKAGVLFENAIIRVIAAGKDAFLSEKTAANAAVYLRAMELYQSTVLLGFDYSVILLEEVKDSPLGNLTGNAEEAAALIKDIREMKAQKQQNYQTFDELVAKSYVLDYGTVYEDISGELENPDVPYTYRVNPDGTVTITGYTGSDSRIRIPDLIDGRWVTGLGESAFSWRDDLTQVILPESITTIEGYAFYFCTNLTDLNIPAGVTDIGECAFIYCRSLNGITLPEGITAIGRDVFRDCRSLTGIRIPDSVKTIADSAFYGCSGLTGVTIPQGLTEIGAEAFAYCSKLTGITIPESVGKIGEAVFVGCSSMEAIRVEAANSAYCDVNGVLFTKNMAVLCQAPGRISGAYGIPQGVVSVGRMAFYGCRRLTGLTVPDSVTRIGYAAFQACSSLSDISLPCKNISFDPYVFNYCIGLTSVAIPEGVTAIGEGMFRGCTNLTEITIPKSVTAVGDVAFEECAALSRVRYGSCGADWTAISVGQTNNALFDAEVVFTHAYKADVTPPSCTLGGYTTYTCTLCGNSYTDNEVAALGHTPGAPVETVTKAPTCTEDGEKSVTTSCVTCGEVLSGDVDVIPALGHSYADGICTVCGEAEQVKVPTVVIMGASLAFKDEVQYNAYFSIIDADGVEITEMGLLTWSSEIDGTIENAENVLPGAVEEDGLLKVRSQPVPAKNMADSIYMKVYLELADGSYIYSTLVNYSAKEYVTNMLNSTTTNAATKALCVALMNYGAEAQKYFGYKTDALMNADLTDEQQALVNDYSENMIPALDSAETDIVCSGGFKSMTASVNFGGALGINYIFTPAKTMDGEMKLYVWTSNDEALTFENASQVLTMEERAGKYTARVGSISARNAGSTVYVCGVYESDGVQYTTGVLAYSVAAYCKVFANTSGAFRPMAEAAAVYAYYADISLN